MAVVVGETFVIRTIQRQGSSAGEDEHKCRCRSWPTHLPSILYGRTEVVLRVVNMRVVGGGMNIKSAETDRLIKG
jgi:hypothetical protein